MNRWLSWPLIGLVFTFSGCRSTGKLSPDLSSEMEAPYAEGSFAAIQAAEKASSGAITFVDKPELQAGTGPMDATVPPEFSKTKSGLRYRVLRHSNGEKPKASNTVSVHYRGWLDNGKVFDSSYERGEPTTFPLQKVVAGWTEGMQLVGQGGMIELWVPSSLGYGERGSPGSIPPHSNIHFIVELVYVN